MEIVIILLVVGGIIVYAMVAAANQRAKELEDARLKYRDSLAKLKADPTNADLRQRTLALGRRYSALTRQNQGSGANVTIYDEVAISNDIGAACAAAVTISDRQVTGGSVSNDSNGSIEARLEKLEALRQRKLITQDEYQARREKLLDEI